MLLSAAWYLLDNAQKKKEIFSRYRFVTVVSILSIQPLWPMPNLTLHKRSVSLEKRWLLTNGNYLPNHNWNPLKCLWNEIFSSFFIGDSGADFRAEHRELICFLPSVLESIYFVPWKWRFLTIRRPWTGTECYQVVTSLVRVVFWSHCRISLLKKVVTVFLFRNVRFRVEYRLFKCTLVK